MVERAPSFLGAFVWTAMDHIGEAGIGATAPVKADIPCYLARFPWVNAWRGDIDLIGHKSRNPGPGGAEGSHRVELLQQGSVITAGMVTTLGMASDAIVAMNDGGGNVAVVATGPVRTGGGSSVAIRSLAGIGASGISAGTVSTAGVNATAILASGATGRRSLRPVPSRRPAPMRRP